MQEFYLSYQTTVNSSIGVLQMGSDFLGHWLLSLKIVGLKWIILYIFSAA